jgi:hypothetical protein
MILLHHAITSLRPDEQWIMQNDDYEQLEWHTEGKTKPSLQELLDEVARLEKIEKENEYKKLRAKEYPTIQDQLDALFHAGAFPTDMAARIQAVKDKYPKS